MEKAIATDEPVEVTELTTETSRLLANPGGTYTQELSPAPVRVQRGSTWIPVDTTLALGADGVIRPSATSVDLEVSNGGSGPVAAIGSGGKSVALTWPSALPKPSIAGSGVTYAEVLPGVDLVVRVDVESFGTYFVVKDAEAAKNPALATLRFNVRAVGLEISSDQGGMAARDEEGRKFFEAAAPQMWDSSEITPSPEVEVKSGSPSAAMPDSESLVDPRDGAKTSLVPLEVSPSSVSVLPDQAMLADPSTTFPVVIDPSVTKTKPSFRMVWGGGKNYATSDKAQLARVGFDGYSDNKVSRSFYRFDVSSLDKKHIFRATFRHHLVHSPNWTCTLTAYGPGVRLFRSDPFTSKTRWPGPAERESIGTNTLVHGHQTLCPGATTLEWNVEGAVQDVDGYLYLGMRSNDESDKRGWRKFSHAKGYPVLEVEYNTKPNTPTGLKLKSPSIGCSTSATVPVFIGGSKDIAPTPTIEARLTDPDKTWSVKANFELYNSSGTRIWSKLSADYKPSPGTRDALATSPKLPALSNGKYSFRVRSEETYRDASGGTEATDVSEWSDKCYIWVDLSRPDDPKVVSEGGKYPCNGSSTDGDGQPTGCDDELHGGVGNPGWFVISSDPDVSYFEYFLNSRDWVRVTPPATTPGKIRVSITPNELGPNYLHVRAVDKAGNYSGEVTYEFHVAPGKAPIGRWKLDEASGTVAADSSGSSTPHPARVHLAGDATNSTWYANGRMSRAIRLNGVDDFLETTGPVIPDTTRSFSVSSWVRIDETTRFEGVLIQAGSRAHAFALYYSPSYNNWVFSVSGEDTDEQAGTVWVPATEGMAIGVWTHLAGVYDSSAGKIRIYVNGRLQGERNFSGGFKSTGKFSVGRMQTESVYKNYFPGAIDDVRVWDRVVDVNELEEQLHETSVSPLGTETKPKLAGGWDFGTTVVDADNRRWITDGSGYRRSLELRGLAKTTLDPDDDGHGRVLELYGSPEDFAATLSPVVDGSGSYTIAAWVKPWNAAPSAVLSQGSSGGTSGPGKPTVWLGLRGSSPRWTFEQYAAPGVGKLVATSDRAPEIVWTHLVVVYDSLHAQLRLYVNGVRKHGVPRAAGAHWQTADVLVGSDTPGTTQLSGFQGYIDDVRIYSGVMDDQQVNVLWRNS